MMHLEYPHLIKQGVWSAEDQKGQTSIKMQADLMGVVEGDMTPACRVTMTQTNGDQQQVDVWFLPVLPTGAYPAWLQKQWDELHSRWLELNP